MWNVVVTQSTHIYVQNSCRRGLRNSLTQTHTGWVGALVGDGRLRAYQIPAVEVYECPSLVETGQLTPNPVICTVSVFPGNWRLGKTGLDWVRFNWTDWAPGELDWKRKSTVQKLIRVKTREP